MQDLGLQAAYYQRQDEASRLDRDAPGMLEKLRTRAILQAELAPASTVLDVGGGAGVHASWLSEQGHHVQLFDPIERHVALARAAAEQLAPADRFDVELADARDIPRGDGCSDAVLLLGPLYHLHKIEDRSRCLAEAFRLLKPGGTLVAAGISRYAWLMDAYRQGLADEPETQASITYSLETGHSTADPKPGSFWAYFHEPAEFLTEIDSAGFAHTRLIAVEGFAWMLPDLPEILESDMRTTQLMQQLGAVESAPTLVGSSSHFVVIGRKPEQ